MFFPNMSLVLYALTVVFWGDRTGRKIKKQDYSISCQTWQYWDPYRLKNKAIAQNINLKCFVVVLKYVLCLCFPSFCRVSIIFRHG